MSNRRPGYNLQLASLFRINNWMEANPIGYRDPGIEIGDWIDQLPCSNMDVCIQNFYVLVKVFDVFCCNLVTIQISAAQTCSPVLNVDSNKNAPCMKIVREESPSEWVGLKSTSTCFPSVAQITNCIKKKKEKWGEDLFCLRLLMKAKICLGFILFKRD